MNMSYRLDFRIARPAPNSSTKRVTGLIKIIVDEACHTLTHRLTIERMHNKCYTRSGLDAN